MPDIKSALQQALERGKREYLNKTLNEWDEDEQKQIKGEVMPAPTKNLFGITNNVSRETFNHIKHNPHLGIAAIRDGMVEKGFKDSTVTTLVYQMAVAGLIVKGVDSTFTAAVPEFKPFNIGKIRKAEKLKRQAEDKAKIAAFGKTELAKKKIVMITRRKAEPVQDASAAGIGALPVSTDVKVDGHKIGTFKEYAPWKPEDTVDTLSLGQAKAVHAYLQKLFGAL
jgi:hypothetical protein